MRGSRNPPPFQGEVAAQPTEGVRRAGAPSGAARHLPLKRGRIVSTVAIASLLLAACGGGSTGGSDSGGVPAPSPGPAPTPVSVYPVPAQEALTIAEVERIVAQAVGEALARGTPGVIAVVDRVGNPLAIFTMTGARATATLRAGTSGNTDLQGVAVPAQLAALAKAITGAYLSSSGNAFSTRTASQIIQEHFPPSAAARGLESGPLFGVQFSQLPCSDLSARASQGLIGPKRSPLGLAADPGGLPLYKNGVVVGGIGVMSDGDYGFDPEIQDVDTDDEELVAVAGSTGFAAATEIRAERITVDGTTLRFTDRETLSSTPASAPAFATINGPRGSLTAIPGYYSVAAIQPGTPYGVEASGLRRATTSEFDNPDAFILTSGAGANRYAPRAATDAPEVASPLTAGEVRTLLEEAFKIMTRARAQIRRPLDSRAQVSISVVDTRGVALGIVRSPDAPIFGTDVSLQKARSVAFFSGPRAGADLAGVVTAAGAPDRNVRDYVTRTNAFVPGLLSGQFAVSNRAIGNLARPFFPDGEVARGPGPLSRPIANFSPFSTGLQSALIVQNLVLALSPSDTPQQCTFLPGPNRLANGLQIFPGGEPIYRGSTLVGAIGMSGDGIDQDDMIGFLGIFNAGTRLNGALGGPPAAIRSDQIVIATPPSNTRLRYVNCPFAPFVDTAEQNVCAGK